MIGGYRPDSNGVDALLVGYHEDRRLRFAGKVQAGFMPHVRRQVFAQLEPLHTTRRPFVDLPTARPRTGAAASRPIRLRRCGWVKPTLVAQVRFVEWRAEGHLRHAAFLGLRRDKRARDVG